MRRGRRGHVDPVTLGALAATSLGSLLYLAGVVGAYAQEIDPGVSTLINGGGPVGLGVGMMLWGSKLFERLGDRIDNRIESVKSDIADEMKAIETRQGQRMAELRTTVERHSENRQ